MITKKGKDTYWCEVCGKEWAKDCYALKCENSHPVFSKGETCYLRSGYESSEHGKPYTEFRRDVVLLVSDRYKQQYHNKDYSIIWSFDYKEVDENGKPSHNIYTCNQRNLSKRIGE